MSDNKEEKNLRIVLPPHGTVRLVDWMGSDGDIAEAARASYQTGTKAVSEDRGLLRYLYSHKHSSPFEMAEIKFHLRMPIFVARQHIRHRTANVNEESGRYSIMREDYYLPELTHIAPQAKNNKQGREAEAFNLKEAEGIFEMLDISSRTSFENYKGMLDCEVARELSRTILPLNTYTTMVWKIDLKNLLHYLTLRTDSHAQYEIRVYAEAMLDLIRPLFPLSIEAWEDYERYAVTFSRMEMDVIFGLLCKAGCPELPEKEELQKEFGLSNREILELKKKIGYDID